jgi:hypothetical protein
MLEITGGEIKNGQHLVHKKQDKTQKHDTTQKTKKMTNMDPTKNHGFNCHIKS